MALEECLGGTSLQYHGEEGGCVCSSSMVSMMGIAWWWPCLLAEGSASENDDGVATPQSYVGMVVVDEGLRKGHFICCPVENPVWQCLHQRGIRPWKNHLQEEGHVFVLHQMESVIEILS